MDGGDICVSKKINSCIQTGSQNSDGRCTVCNRFHEDFAHIVDVNNAGEIQRTVHSGQNARQDANRNNIENLSYSDDSNSSSPRLNQRLGATSNNSSRNNHSGTRVLPHEDYDDEDDVDLSGNDLIPPSYDLSPPSYDEAVNMPKPDSSVSPSGRQQQTSSARPRQEVINGGCTTIDPAETDPLYQNIDGLAR